MGVISLFSGAGGLDIGFRNAGFDIILALESDPSCCQTLRKNNPDLNVLEGDISTISSQEIMNAAGVAPLEADLVIGGPPCQPFSLAGKREGLNDPRGQLLKEYIRVVHELLPVGFVFENVKGLVNWDKGNALKLLLDELKKPVVYNGETYQYSVQYDVLNAVNYGVPQYRERLILIGNRLNRRIEFPKPTHSKTPNEDNCEPLKTTWDVIGSLPPATAPSATAMRVAKTIKKRIEAHGF